MTANGEVQTHEEAQVYVHDLDLFVTVQLLDCTPAVLSLGKLCSEHGFSDERQNGQNPQLTQNGITITCIMDSLVLLVVPAMSSHLPAAARLLHRGQRTGQLIPKDCGKPIQTDPEKLATGNLESARTKRRDGHGESIARHSWLVTAFRR